MSNESQRTACKRYYERNKEKYMPLYIRIDREKHRAAVERLKSVKSKSEYVIGLVERDLLKSPETPNR